MNDNKLREALAEVSHEIWAHWMRYLFSVCDMDDQQNMVIPLYNAMRWDKQIVADYADLTEREKDSDREQADKILVVLKRMDETEY